MESFRDVGSVFDSDRNRQPVVERFNEIRARNRTRRLEVGHLVRGVDSCVGAAGPRQASPLTKGGGQLGFEQSLYRGFGWLALPAEAQD